MINDAKYYVKNSINFNNTSINSDKENNQEKNISKTYLYKKINNYSLIEKSNTLIEYKNGNKKNKNIKEKQENEEKQKRQENQENQENRSKNKLKLRLEENEKKYIDSTFLVKDEKSKIEENKNIIEEEPFAFHISLPFHNNGK